MRYLIHLLAVMLLATIAGAQTTCSLSQTEPGVHLCFPSAGSNVPPVVHISAEINAPEGKLVSGYTIKVDNVLVGVDAEKVPAHQLAVEGTLGAPLAPGEHSIRIEAAGIGEAETKVLVKAADGIVPCASVTNVPQWVCTARPYKGEPTAQSLFAALQSSANAHFSFDQFAHALLQDLEALQLDSMEVAAIDDSGNIYTASHALSDIEVRKYGPGGHKLEFATVVSSCGPGFTALDGIAITNEGQVWIAGHSTGCFEPTTNALARGSSTKSGEEQSFLLRVNARLTASSPLTYFSFLPEAAHSRISGLHPDQNGNVYIAGYTTSSTFPHQHVLSLGSHSPDSDVLSFVTLLKADGSALLNSVLLQGVHVTALTVDNEMVAIAGADGTRSPNHNASSNCCSETLATLSTDLSVLTSRMMLPRESSSGIKALAATDSGELLAVGYGNNPGARALDASSIRATIYSWSPGSRRPSCFRVLSANTMPTLINVPTLNAYARIATSNPACQSEVRPKTR